MKSTRLTKIPFLTEEQYKEIVNTGSVLVNGELMKKEDYQIFIVPDTGEGSGGTKLYRHSITCYIENAYTGDILEIEDDNVITTNPTKYENINDAMNDAIRCGAKFVCGGGGLIFIANGWYAVHDGQVINDGLSYNVLTPFGVQQVVVAEMGDPYTISVFLADSKVEVL